MNFSKKIIIIIISFFFVSQVSALSVRSTLDKEIESRFIKTISEVVRINKEIQRNPKNILMNSLFSRRETLTRYAKNLYSHLEKAKSIDPTFDVSSRYKLTLQKYLLSCEIAALRTIIEAVSGVYYSEESIIREIPHFAKPLRDGVWGDPEKEFVGLYNGSQAKATGYGVYGLPLARYLDKQGYDNEYRNTLMSTGITSHFYLDSALTLLEKGNHVMLWGDYCTTPEYEDGIVDKVDMYTLRAFPISGRNPCERSLTERQMEWKTNDGERIQGVSGEHAFILLGYAGKKEDPTHIIVWDTDTGKHIYPIFEWMRKWSVLDYRMLIVEDNSSYKSK